MLQFEDVIRIVERLFNEPQARRADLWKGHSPVYHSKSRFEPGATAPLRYNADMEDLPEYADLLGRGGEDIAMSAASYLYSMANFGEPWKTGVRDACLVLEKLDFSKEHHEANIREIIDEVNAILDDDVATYEHPGFVKLGEFNFRTANGYWDWDQDGTDNRGTLGFTLRVPPPPMIAEAICLCYIAHTAFRSR